MNVSTAADPRPRKTEPTRSEPTEPLPVVASVMSAPAVAVDVQDSLWTAMDVMITRNLRHLVVTRRGTACGVVSDRELAAVWAMDPLGLKGRRAEHTIGPDRAFISPDTDVVTAAARMRHLGVDALVVVEPTLAPLGVVTDHDLLGVLASLLRDRA